MLMACSGQEISSTPKIFATLTSSPQPTITIQPSLTSTPIPTVTFTATPDACSKQTIPTDTVFPESTRVSHDKFIALREGNMDKVGEVFLTNMDGDVIKNVTNHPADDISPEWSPNSEQIAFLSNRSGKIPTSCLGPSDDCMYQLFGINPDGTGLRPITKDWTFQYSWSPDGKQVAFVRAVKSGISPDPNKSFLYEIYSVNSDGTNLHNLTNSPGIYFDFVQPNPDKPEPNRKTKRESCSTGREP
jgi:Tol biopolymer transport system component